MTIQPPPSLRQAFGRFMTGVTVVTTRSERGEMVGFTANSFTSVSLDPPLLLVCPGQHLSSYHAFAACTHFAVSILAADQAQIATRFARSKSDRFADTPHVLDGNDIPLITGAAAQFSCATHSATVAGDHLVLVGLIQTFSQSPRETLGYLDGQFIRPSPISQNGA